MRKSFSIVSNELSTFRNLPIPFHFRTISKIITHFHSICPNLPLPSISQRNSFIKNKEDPHVTRYYYFVLAVVFVVAAAGGKVDEDFDVAAWKHQ
mmetsp:Transcript_16340/g.24069  ORF Transcript_16340/g.24069 Transcript_16340/m.24069 type:complete len:95 (+) Transcript_16340:108-392(+)